MNKPMEIAIVDNGIPAVGNVDLTHRITSADLGNLLSSNWNSENALKELINALLSDKKWRVSGFSHPEFFLQACKDELYRPDVVVYDWDYPAGNNSDEMLLEILKTTFCAIGIFTVADKVEEIEKTLTSAAVAPYANRLIPRVDKSDTESHKKIADKLEELFNTNFSFKFNKSLRLASIEAIEHLLIEFGRVTIEKIIGLFSDNEEEFNEVDFREFIARRVENNLKENAELLEVMEKEGFEKAKALKFLNLVSEKLKNDLQDVVKLKPLLEKPVKPEEDIASNIWSYRLYYKPNDGLFRRGDIVINKDDKKNADTLFLVITADCDLTRFWKKNFGFVNCVPLHEINSADQYVKNQLRLTNKKIDPSSVSSLANNAFNASQDLLLLPFIEIDNKKLCYALFPKEIKAVKIDSGETNIDKLKTLPLKYSDCPNYELVCSLSEPFLTPVIEHILHSIAGYGTPDYPGVVRDLLRKNINGINS